jgi:hypothetical protein
MLFNGTWVVDQYGRTRHRAFRPATAVEAAIHGRQRKSRAVHSSAAIRSRRNVTRVVLAAVLTSDDGANRSRPAFRVARIVSL